jgi:hypothetical protein
MLLMRFTQRAVFMHLPAGSMDQQVFSAKKQVLFIFGPSVALPLPPYPL